MGREDAGHATVDATWSLDPESALPVDLYRARGSLPGAQDVRVSYVIPRPRCSRLSQESQRVQNTTQHTTTQHTTPDQAQPNQVKSGESEFKNSIPCHPYKYTPRR